MKWKNLKTIYGGLTNFKSKIFEARRHYAVVNQAGCFLWNVMSPFKAMKI